MNNKIMQRDIEYLKDMDRYLEKLKKMDKKKAIKYNFGALRRIGIIDNGGNLKAPYNGEKINSDDFTRGPKRIKCKR